MTAPPLTDLTGRTFVITGLSHLTVRVAAALVARDATVSVIGHPDADREAHEVASLLDESVRLIVPTRDHDQTLIDAGLLGADGLLAVADADIENLRWAADAHELAPDVPLVLRTFQPELGEHLSESLNIRRAFSVAGLAAPAFVAASFSERVIETLRLADDEIPLCVLDVRDGSPLLGADLDEIRTATSCGIVAVQRAGSAWEPADAAGRPLEQGDRVLAGGRRADVLRLAVRNDPGLGSDVVRPSPRRRSRHRGSSTSLLPVSAALFAALFLVTALVNHAVFDLDASDSVATAVAAAFGNGTPATDSKWVQVFNLAAMIGAFVLLWILLSHITALVLAERLDQRMVRRARRVKDHVVVVGLGRVGYRVVQLLAELDVPTVVIEHDVSSRFTEAARERTVVLTGDGQLPENLERAGITRARCVIACTTDDLANLAVCLAAKRANPAIRTVTRAFDDQLAFRLSKAFRVDVALSSTATAAAAFVGAATDSLAMRAIRLDGIDLLAFRFTPSAVLSPEEIERWRAQGMRVLAVVHADGTVETPSTAASREMEPGDEAILVGPAPLIREFATATAPA